MIEIDSKNLNSRHSFKISTYLRYYYLKAYKIINEESYKKRWEIEDQNIRNNFPEEIIVKAKINDFSNQSYPLEEYSTSNNWFRSHGNNFSTRFSNFNSINNENVKNIHNRPNGKLIGIIKSNNILNLEICLIEGSSFLGIKIVSPSKILMFFD